MSESEGRFSKARLEAFSDGVIAVIITIMVLDLKAPEFAEPSALFKLWPSFAIYLVSFVFVAIYWINHHNLLTAARRVTARLIWANNALLFCLSLIPFATAYVGDTDLAPFPTMVYGALQFACAVAFNLVVSTIGADRQDDGEFMEGVPPAPGPGSCRTRRLRRRRRARPFQPGRGARALRPRRTRLSRARSAGRKGDAQEGALRATPERDRPCVAPS